MCCSTFGESNVDLCMFVFRGLSAFPRFPSGGQTSVFQD